MKAVLRSCHHGDVSRPNQLGPARGVLERYAEIDVVEIDFVSYCGEIWSAHDYALDQIEQGATLRQWVELVVLQHRKVLWLDIKENCWWYCNWMYGQFDARLLFRRLRALTAIVAQHGVDLRQHLWIGCQQLALRQRLLDMNRYHKHRFCMMLDAPTLWGYVAQRLMPCVCLTPTLSAWLADELRKTDMAPYGVLSVDQSFFATTAELQRFLRALRLPPDLRVVLNSYARSVAPVRVRGVQIVMQYDYYEGGECDDDGDEDNRTGSVDGDTGTTSRSLSLSML